MKYIPSNSYIGMVNTFIFMLHKKKKIIHQLYPIDNNNYCNVIVILFLTNLT